MNKTNKLYDQNIQNHIFNPHIKLFLLLSLPLHHKICKYTFCNKKIYFYPFPSFKLALKRRLAKRTLTNDLSTDYFFHLFIIFIGRHHLSHRRDIDVKHNVKPDRDLKHVLRVMRVWEAVSLCSRLNSELSQQEGRSHSLTSHVRRLSNFMES